MQIHITSSEGFDANSENLDGTERIDSKSKYFRQHNQKF